MSHAMTAKGNRLISRRQFIRTAAVASASLSSISSGPSWVFGQSSVQKPMNRVMGRLNFEATTLGLGGQASLMWTPADVDPIKIILKAHALGINYFDTSNLYGPSQANYGKAFRELNLIPGVPGYRESLRRTIFLTSKTGLRWAKGGGTRPGMTNLTDGPHGSHTLDDIRRSLTQIFGDRQGYYPPGAYLDMVLIHSLKNASAELDVLYDGLDHPDPHAENIGTLAVLRDIRDGTNLTGLNPREEKLIRHIGFSGHLSPPTMIEMIQRDEQNILDGMLVAVNANDRLQFNMQYNVIPVAAAKNMGLIGMKVFADGAFYTKPANWTRGPQDVVRTVGSDTMPSQALVHYTLSTPGIHTAIIGIGQISSDPKSCQMEQNLAAAQIDPQGLSESDRRAIEKKTALVKEGKTNYFQLPKELLTPPGEAAAAQEMRDGKRMVRLSWQTAFAGDEPIMEYEIWRDRQKIGQIRHQPQISRKPFLFEETLADKLPHQYRLSTMDATGRQASTEDLIIPAAS